MNECEFFKKLIINIEIVMKKKIKKNFPEGIVMRMWLQHIKENGLPSDIERINNLIEENSKKLKITKSALAKFTKEQYSILFSKITAKLEKNYPNPVELNEIAMLVMKSQVGIFDGLALTLAPKKVIMGIKTGAKNLDIPQAELVEFAKVLHAELLEKIGLTLDEFIITKKK